jgi:hypothetical protein
MGTEKPLLPNGSPVPSGRSRVLGVIGLLAYLVVGGFPYLASGLMVPGPWLYILWAVWVVGLILAWRVFRVRPAMTLAFAPAALAVWAIYVYLGEQLLGWTA